MIDLFEHSGYFADQLLRYPELLEEIGEPFQLEGGALSDGVALRRFYRRQMLRIQSDSMLEARADLRDAGQNLGAGGQRDRGGVPDRGARKRRRPPIAGYRRLTR